MTKFFAQFPKEKVLSYFEKNQFYLQIFLWAHKMQYWQHFWKMLPKLETVSLKAR